MNRLRKKIHSTPQRKSEKRHSLASLFLSFFKIGCFTFGGGYAMIPLIEREVIDRRKWIERDDFLELLTLAQSAPGPISLNTSVFVGYKAAGYAGAFAAIAGVVIPSFVIILLIAIFFSDIRTNLYVEAAFKGIRPAVVALIATPVINMARGLGRLRTLVAVVAAALVWLLGLSPVWLIVAGALGGILYNIYNKKGLSVIDKQKPSEIDPTEELTSETNDKEDSI